MSVLADVAVWAGLAAGLAVWLAGWWRFAVWATALPRHALSRPLTPAERARHYLAIGWAWPLIVTAAYTRKWWRTLGETVAARASGDLRAQPPRRLGRRR